MQCLLGEEEDLPPANDDYDIDALEDGGNATSGSTRGQHRRQPGGPSHGQCRLRFEEHFRTHNDEGVQLRIMMQKDHAANSRRDLEQQLAALQQRVIDYIENPKHPSCPAGAGRVIATAWRRIICVSLLGTGAIEIPTLRCVAGALQQMGSTGTAPVPAKQHPLASPPLATPACRHPLRCAAVALPPLQV